MTHGNSHQCVGHHRHNVEQGSNCGIAHVGQFGKEHSPPDCEESVKCTEYTVYRVLPKGSDTFPMVVQENSSDRIINCHMTIIVYI